MKIERNALRRKAHQMSIQWLNGQKNDVDEWIGNSATRLAMVYDALAVHGSNEVRCFMDSFRYRRDI